MENKLLIFEQNYDIVEFPCIIDRKDLEDYIIHWKDNYISRQGEKIKVEYVSHSITENDSIVIKFFRHEYTVLGRIYTAQFYYDGFNYIDLDKTPTWTNEKSDK